MSSLNAIVECPKCGNHDQEVKYHSGRGTRGHALQGLLEYLQVRCRRCGFSQRVVPMDDAVHPQNTEDANG